MDLKINFILMLISFLITILTLPSFIVYLHKLKFGQTIREEGPESHAAKKGTPTMGGLAFVLSIVVTLIIAAIINSENAIYYSLFIYTTLSFALIGYLDDMLIVVKKKNDGLKPKQKLGLQILFSVIFYILLRKIYGEINYIELPFTDFNIDLSLAYILFVIFWQTGFSNAVNLTDGLDGLATSVTIITSLAFALISYNENNQAVLTFCLIIAAALTGFLLFNKKPAKIFMGDTGSLALGGMLAAISIILHKEVAFLFIGLVYILETLSVMLQVAYFKKTGKRIFKMSPLHHHFELSGYGEVKTVWIFVVIAAVSSTIGYFIGVM